MKQVLIISLMSMSFASVQCMEKSPLLENSNTPPPPYAAASTAPNLDAISNPGVTVPQPAETYMTYQQWWVRNRVPTDIQCKSMREQEEWAAQRNVERNAERTKEQQNMVEEAETNGCFKGSLLAAVICVLLHP
jgi:hypothetical protein